MNDAVIARVRNIDTRPGSSAGAPIDRRQQLLILLLDCARSVGCTPPYSAINDAEAYLEGKRVPSGKRREDIMADLRAALKRRLDALDRDASTDKWVLSPNEQRERNALRAVLELK